jgi:hypothetical protein
MRQPGARRLPALLAYFDDAQADAAFRCGTCDGCLHPPEWRAAPPDHPELYPRPAASPLPRPDSQRQPRLRAGQKVCVPEYGEGEIKTVDGDHVEVSFTGREVRTFKRAFLAPRRSPAS